MEHQHTHEPDMWIQESHNIIDSAYNTAIDNYTIQKQNFLTQLQLTSDDAAKEFLEEVQKQIAEELNADSDKEIEAQINAGLEEIAAMVTSAASGTNTIRDMGKQLLQDKTTNQERLIDRHGKRAKEELDKMLHNTLKLNKDKIMQAFLQASGRSLSEHGGDIAWGAARKVLYNYIATGEIKTNFEGHKQSLKGEYREIIVTKALQKVMEKFGPVGNIVEQIGSNNQNAKNISPIYDILIGLVQPGSFQSLESIGSQMDEISRSFNGRANVKEAVNAFSNYFGVQSKSWSVNFDINGKLETHKWFLTIASRADLQPKGELAYHWHVGMFNAMSNIMSVLGLRQTLFSTGSDIYFTADLLKNFRASNYVLAFATQKVKGQDTYKIVKPEIYFRHHYD